MMDSCSIYHQRRRGNEKEAAVKQPRGRANVAMLARPREVWGNGRERLMQLHARRRCVCVKLLNNRVLVMLPSTAQYAELMGGLRARYTPAERLCLQT